MSKIQIKRGTGAPDEGVLATGELGFDTEGKELYIGGAVIVDENGNETTPIVSLTKGMVFANSDEVSMEDATIPLNADTFQGYNTIPVSLGGTGATDSTTALTNLGAVNKTGDTMTGTLTAPQIDIVNPTNAYPGITISCSDGTNNGKTQYAVAADIGQAHITEWANGSNYYESYHLPTPATDLTENKNYSVLTNKDLVTVDQGGTGKATHTTNAVLTGNGTSAIKNVATASGAFYATAENSAPQFGVLPYAQGGTGYALKDVPKYAIMRNAGDGDYMWYIATANGAFYATGTNEAAKFGTLPIAQGGTGATTAAEARTNLGLNPTVLWTNPAPSSKYGSSPFPTISLDLSSYRFVLISFLTTTGGSNYAGTILVPVDDTSSGDTNDTITHSVHIQYKPAAADFYDRYARATTTGVVISTGRTITSFSDTSWSVDNSLLVPYQIFGIV